MGCKGGLVIKDKFGEEVVREKGIEIDEVKYKIKFEFFDVVKWLINFIVCILVVFKLVFELMYSCDGKSLWCVKVFGK